MNRFLLLLCLLTASVTMMAQRVYSTDHEYQANVNVYVTDHEYQADL